MGRWSLIGAVIFGGVFALFAFWRVDVIDSQTARALTAAFLFGLYCAIVAFGTSEKKRSLSLSSQTLLGVALGLVLAALFNVPAEGYVAAFLIGLILGISAHKWVAHVQLP
jgi:uncharacterized membrane protein